MKIEFSTGNAAFEDFDIEVKRILEKIICEIEDGSTSGSIIDINGNKVGHWDVDE